jgi:hypothetical protein
MKRASTGGIDPTSPTTTLNLWVCTIGGILGYAQLEASSTDGVAIDSNILDQLELQLLLST